MSFRGLFASFVTVCCVSSLSGCKGGGVADQIAHALTSCGDYPSSASRSGAGIRAPQTRTSWFRGVAVTHDVIDGWAVVEGDVLLGRPGELPEATGRLVIGDGDQSSVAIRGDQYRWPGGVIPYEIAADVPNPQRIISAAAHWNAMLGGVIQVVPRTGEAAYIRFNRAPSAGTCSSYVGYYGYAGQPILVGDACGTGNLIHEIGHAVGMWHEQSRADRNQYVRIHYENIDPAYAFNFSQAISTGIDIATYDFDSVMHYPAYAFTMNGLPTIETIPAGIPIGQRSALSAGDVAGAYALYTGQVIAGPVPSSAGASGCDSRDAESVVPAAGY